MEPKRGQSRRNKKSTDRLLREKKEGKVFISSSFFFFFLPISLSLLAFFSPNSTEGKKKKE